MQVQAHSSASAAVWNPTLPANRHAIPGVAMAGFRGSASDLVDLPIVPSPWIDVFIDFGDGRLIDGAGTVRSGAAVVGLGSGGLRVTGRAVDCLQIRLSPTYARRLFGDTVGDDGAMALDDVWSARSPELIDRIHDTTDWDDRFTLMTAALSDSVSAGPRLDDEIAYAWRCILASEGRVRIEALADRLGWSRQRLWSRFRGHFGITPKHAARLIRFDAAAHALTAGRDPAEVAADHGYVDQSHLHRDTRAFAATTPAAVARANWLDVDSAVWAPQFPRFPDRPL